MKVRTSRRQIASHPLGFNPRTREGANNKDYYIDTYDIVSIHAPVKVRTSTHGYEQVSASFNPRTREGAN